MSDDAIVMQGVTKHFKKSALRREYSTLKTELVRLLRGQRKVIDATQHIEALRGVDLRIPKGRTVGIIGRNGSGKSTLLKLMTGIYAPTSGTIDVKGRISALLELGAGFHPDFSGRENIMINGIILGMTRAEVKERTPEIIKFAELGDFIEEPVRTYSSGMYMRLAFAVATHVDPDVLIIDEILAVGDEHFSRKSMAKMNEFKASGRTIVLVTHGLDSVESWCDLAVWIDGGKVRLVGDPKVVVSEYRRAVSAAEAETLQTGSSALSAPGLALPEVTPAPPPVVRLPRLRVTDGLGKTSSSFSADGRLELMLDYELDAPAVCEFMVELVAPNRHAAFTTRLQAGELAAGKGTARLVVVRLGLGEGTWSMRGRMTGQGFTTEPIEVPFAVAPHPSAEGMLRLEHAWTLESAGAEGTPVLEGAKALLGAHGRD